MLYFSSDHHFGHENILEYCNRPFKDLEEMHLALVTNHNAVVTEKDDVWFLGDLVYKMKDFETAKYFIKMMRGRKNLVYGNHDKKYRAELAELFDTVQDYKELKYNKQKIILMHFPIEQWNGKAKGTTHLHGHGHCTYPFNPELRRLDVGVDGHNYEPISFDRVMSIMENPNEFKYQI